MMTAVSQQKTRTVILSLDRDGMEAGVPLKFMLGDLQNSLPRSSSKQTSSRTSIMTTKESVASIMEAKLAFNTDGYFDEGVIVQDQLVLVHLGTVHEQKLPRSHV